MTITKMVKSEPVATATPENLMVAVRESRLSYSEEGLEGVCIDMTYGERSLPTVPDQTPDQTMVGYLADASLDLASQIRYQRHLRELSERISPVVMQGGTVVIDRCGAAKRLMDALDEGEKIAAKTE